MMIKRVLLLLILSVLFQMCRADNNMREAAINCASDSDRGQVNTALPCYLAKPDNSFSWALHHMEKQRIATRSGQSTVSVYSLVMTSQSWNPGDNSASPQTISYEVNYPLWQHRINIFVPSSINTTTALLYINGGIIHPDPDQPSRKVTEDLNFAAIAANSHSIVINLKDIPNQFLSFSKSGFLKEDDLIAFTWRQFLNDPVSNIDWPLQLPMVKSAIRAMDMAQIFLKEHTIPVEQFVVSGGSKRGWTAWLSAAMDKRVVAVVPMVIDVLNIRKSMDHHQNAYGFWAPAIKSYHSLMLKLNDPDMEKLFTIVDPLNYRRLLHIPKYIVTASADDFFLPDSSQFYFPGTRRR